MRQSDRTARRAPHHPVRPSAIAWRFAGILLLLPALTAGAGFALDRRVPPGMELKNGVLYPKEVVPPGREPATGLQREFPPIVTRPDNPTTPQRVDLGRLLFFDPVLSGNNKMSCAHCHHPDLGFSDGLPRARGRDSEGVGDDRKGGVELPRSAPSLWNALYNHRQYWDGRAKDLEEQARFPITEPDEMNGNKALVAQKLKAIPEYRQLFDRAFGGKDGSSVTFENVTHAIAAFERTLVSFHSRFDRYAAGDSDAMTPAEKHGLKLFLSTKLRCSECHGLPTFANRDFKVIGVPNPKDGPEDPHKPNADPGRGGGPTGAFKIPTLRNIALTAPYMHNGTFKTLDDVLEFYEHGGGRGQKLDIPLQDDKIRKYKFLPGEKKDLIAFLNALTDTSALPEFPKSVPSGLPIVPHLTPRIQTTEGVKGRRGEGENLRLAALMPHRSSLIPHPSSLIPSKVVEVKAGESIQDAVEKAGRGGTVRIYPGEYFESILVIQHDVTIEGVVQDGKRPVLDGQGKLSDAVVGMGNRFTIQGLEIRNFVGNGVVVNGAKQVTFRDLKVENTGTYALYPVGCDGVIVEKCFVSGAKDAGIYVGQSQHIVVRGNEVVQSVAGIEIENSVHSLVESNYVHDNTGGILVFVLPNNLRKDCYDTRVIHNRVIHNNVPNFADPDAFVKNVLKGTGIMVFAADKTEVTGNEIIGNGSFGIAVSSLRTVFPPSFHYDVDPNPDDNRIYGNILKDNAKDPDERLQKYGIPPKDLIWDLSGTGNSWEQPGATSFPPKLPSKTATAK